MDPNWRPNHDEVVSAALHNIAECAKRPYYHNIRGFRFSPKDLPDDVYVWVKYGNTPEGLRCEANTQYYVHDELLKMGDEARQRFYVPKVFDYFETELDVTLYLIKESCRLSYGIIVMEYVTGTAISQILQDLEFEYAEPNGQTNGGQTQSEDADPTDTLESMPTPAQKSLQDNITVFKDLVADSISFFLSFPPPADVTPGPVGGGLIMHWAFGKDDSYAPREFANLKDLEDFINEKITKKWPDIAPAKLTQEGLKLCYCDLNLDNFLLENPDDPSSRVIIIDFEHAGFLPHSFLTWEIWDKREFDIEERVRTQSNLELSRDNVYAIHALLRKLTWESQI
ncbi:hypothetical protein CkaCkLH20_03584 [Colletotrichum karsti]|uniref:Aminoglycoside phosphotransferase domain-containing protein n=1 Tax=Colletotrichum karsti TaxID=1095194 RepID=A0A9P6LJT0_9PEZI|nr:uncharacterized protein CkaCkLH20_03584 [Colletotrichum karsti]KAF9878684.1 hypothetical protein CkaCkLH20_03584 [Colletotrichum karsti]